MGDCAAVRGCREDFFNADMKELGYRPNRVVPQLSRCELKRGSASLRR